MNPPAIVAEDLWHRYPNGHDALRGINLTVDLGEILAIVGENGAGKTTLFKHFNGLLKPSRGRVTVMGKDTAHTRTAVLAEDIGFVFQNPDHQIFCDSVFAEVAFGPRRLRWPTEEVAVHVEEGLRAVGLWEFRDEHPYALSRGQRQRIAVASVLAMRPKIVVVDEPTTGQDIRQVRQFLQLIDRKHAEGATVLLVTHDMRIVAECAQRVVVLGNGQVLADGPPATVLRQTEMLAQTNLKPPQITRVGLSLGAQRTWLNIDDAENDIANTTLRSGSA